MLERNGAHVVASKEPSENPVATAAVDRLVSRRRAGYADDAARLIRACRDIIAESGDYSPPVGKILERAGLSSRAFYRLFSTKDELLVAVLQDGTNIMVTHIEQQMGMADGPLAQIEAWARSALSPYDESSTSHTGSLLRYFARLGEGVSGEVARIRDEFLSPLITAITELRPGADDESTYRAAEFINYAYVGLVSRSENHGRALDKAVIDAFCRYTELVASEFILPTDR